MLIDLSYSPSSDFASTYFDELGLMRKLRNPVSLTLGTFTPQTGKRLTW